MKRFELLKCARIGEQRSYHFIYLERVTFYTCSPCACHARESILHWNTPKATFSVPSLPKRYPDEYMRSLHNNHAVWFSTSQLPLTLKPTVISPVLAAAGDGRDGCVWTDLSTICGPKVGVGSESGLSMAVSQRRDAARAPTSLACVAAVRRQGRRCRCLWEQKVCVLALLAPKKNSGELHFASLLSVPKRNIFCQAARHNPSSRTSPHPTFLHAAPPGIATLLLRSTRPQLGPAIHCPPPSSLTYSRPCEPPELVTPPGAPEHPPQRLSDAKTKLFQQKGYLV